jgi:hypothetical protein
MLGIHAVPCPAIFIVRSKNAGAFDTTRQNGAMWAEGDAQLPYSATKVVRLDNDAVKGNSIYQFAYPTSRGDDM